MITLDNIIKRSISQKKVAPLLASGSLVLSSYALAQQPSAKQPSAQQDNANLCAEIAKCNENDKKPAKASCTDLYEGKGMCMQENVAGSLGLKDFKKGYCPGSETNLCYDTKGTDLVNDVARNRESLRKLDSDYQAFKNTVSNFMGSSEQLHRILGKTLQPELQKLDRIKKAAVNDCKKGNQNDQDTKADKKTEQQRAKACLTSFITYHNETAHLTALIRKNLLETEAEERLRIALLIDGRLNGYFKDVLDAARDLIDRKTPKVSLGLHADYGASILNADSRVSHGILLGGDVLIYFPSSGLSVGLRGSYILGTNLEHRSVFGPFTKVSSGEDSSDQTTSRGTIYTSINWNGSLGFFTDKYLSGSPLTTASLALRLGENISWGNQKTTTATSTTTQFYKADGTPEGPAHNVGGADLKERTLIKSTTYGGLSLCYNKLGPLSFCVNGAIGLGVTAEDDPQVSVESGLGAAIKYNLF